MTNARIEVVTRKTVHAAQLAASEFWVVEARRVGARWWRVFAAEQGLSV
jgi:hypothetical protein